jgi:hypothetical protein
MDPTSYSGMMLFVIALWGVIGVFYGFRFLRYRAELRAQLEDDLTEPQGTLGKLEDLKRELLGPLWWKARVFSLPISTGLTLLAHEPGDSPLHLLMVFLFFELVFAQWVGILFYVFLIASLPEREGSRRGFKREEVAKSISGYLKQGRKLAKEGDYKGAIKAFSGVFKIDPDHAEAFYLIGGCHYQEGRDKAAIQNWKRAAELDPRHRKSREWLDKVAPGWDSDETEKNWKAFGRKAGVLAAKGLLICGVAAAIVVVIDERGIRSGGPPQAPPPPKEPSLVSHTGLAMERFVDPKGAFSIHAPYGWKAQVFPNDPRSRVAFLGYEPGDLQVTVRRMPNLSQDALVEMAHRERERTQLDVKIDKADFQGFPAVRKDYAVDNRRFQSFDFAVGEFLHQVGFSAAPEAFFQILPLAKASLETYEPLNQDSQAFASKQQQADRKREMAELAVARGDRELADLFVKEGLAALPGEESLMRLAQKLHNQSETPGAATLTEAGGGTTGDGATP